MKIYLLKRLIIPVLIFFACYWMDSSIAMLFSFFFVSYGIFFGVRKSRLNQANLTNDLYINQILNTKDKSELPEFCLLLTNKNNIDFENHLFYSLFCMIVSPIAIIHNFIIKDYKGLSVFLTLFVGSISYFKGYYNKYQDIQQQEFSRRLYIEITKEYFVYGKDDKRVVLEWKNVNFDLYSETTHSPLEIHIDFDNERIILEHYQLTVDIYQLYEVLFHYHKLMTTNIRPYKI